MKSARDEILDRLRKAEKCESPQRIELPPPYEAALTLEELIEKFAAKLAEQTGIFYRAADSDGVVEILSEIAEQEGLKSIMASEDALVMSLDLPSWGKNMALQYLFPRILQTGQHTKTTFLTMLTPVLQLRILPLPNPGPLPSSMIRPMPVFCH